MVYSRWVTVCYRITSAMTSVEETVDTKTLTAKFSPLSLNSTRPYTCSSNLAGPWHDLVWMHGESILFRAPGPGKISDMPSVTPSNSVRTLTVLSWLPHTDLHLFKSWIRITLCVDLFSSSASYLKPLCLLLCQGFTYLFVVHVAIVSWIISKVYFEGIVFILTTYT